MRKKLAHILFHIHLALFLFFPLAFFIPSRIWPRRIEVHFLLSLGLFFMFYLWGLIWTIKLKNKMHAVCVLDTITQKLRGYSIWDPQNYSHNFMEELGEKLGLPTFSPKIIPVLSFLAILITGALYWLKLNGVVLY